MVLDVLLPTGLLMGFALFLVRASALVIASPALGGRVGMGAFKIALIVALAFAAFAASGSPALPSDTEAVSFIAMAARELVLGFFLAFLLQLALIAARVAGQMVGLEMGMQMASQVDPQTGESTPLLARMQEELFLMGFLMLDGHHLVVRSLVDSFERAPAGELKLNAQLGTFSIGMFGDMFAAGIAFAAPILALMALVTTALGLLARTVPQINVLELGFTLRIGLALVALYVFNPLLEPALESMFSSFQDWTGRGLDLLEVS